MFLHACEKHISIPFLFISGIVIHDTDLLEHQPGDNGIALLFPLVA